MTFTRRSLGDVAQRAAESYTSTGGTTPPCSTAHAPEAMQLQRELLATVEPTEGLTDPMQRAMSRLQNAEEVIAQLWPSGFEEAKQIEAEIRSGRPPLPEPTLSDHERMQRARAAIDRGQR